MTTTVRLIDRNRSTFGAAFERRLQRLEQAVDLAALNAANEATRVSKSKAKALRPPTAPRRGRRQAPGALARAIDWKAVDGNVVLDRRRLDAEVPFWIVQEIGTGNKAVSSGLTPKRGRPSKADYGPGGRAFNVKSQIGRRIPGHLGFGTSPTGRYTAPGSRRDQQLHLLATMKGVPLKASRRDHDLRITREIKPKGFIKQGGREGFRDYRQDVLAAARATLVKKT